jgi:hypothetical protein
MQLSSLEPSSLQPKLSIHVGNCNEIHQTSPKAKLYEL